MPPLGSSKKERPSDVCRVFQKNKKSSAASFGFFHQKRYLPQTLGVFPSPSFKFSRKRRQSPRDSDKQLPPLGSSRRERPSVAFRVVQKSNKVISYLLDFTSKRGTFLRQEGFFRLSPTKKAGFFHFLSLRIAPNLRNCQAGLYPSRTYSELGSLATGNLRLLSYYYQAS